MDSGFLSLCVLGLLWGLPALIPSFMAEKRGRSPFGWYVFSFVFSFILGIVILLLLGDTEDRRREKILEDEDLRQSYRK
ncbi:MAG: hypothetical protein LBV71_05275 [Prevotella sp.]|jgi:drug/metabolite transporter (DMT)-like permease|nr:hypothetical protein [Prevotella sp.]